MKQVPYFTDRYKVKANVSGKLAWRRGNLWGNVVYNSHWHPRIPSGDGKTAFETNCHCAVSFQKGAIGPSSERLRTVMRDSVISEQQR